MSKTKFTIEEHNILGENLQKMRDYLLSITVEISKAYPVTGKELAKANKALTVIDSFRSTMDDTICKEHQKEENITKVYYRS